MEYLTKEKKDELEKELTFLKSVRRKEIADALEYAKSLGDLSENAEYHQAREDQAATEDRIAHLEEVLKNAVLITDKVAKGSGINVGMMITLRKKGEKKDSVYELVGSEEADVLTGKVSNESPLGVALLGKEKGDTVHVHAPKGEMTYEIIEVK